MVVKVYSIGVSQSLGLGSTASSPQAPGPYGTRAQTSVVRRAHAPHAAYCMEARNTFGTMSSALASRRPRHTGWAPDMADCSASLEAGPRKPTPPLRCPLAAAPRRALTERAEHMQRVTSWGITNLRGSGRGRPYMSRIDSCESVGWGATLVRSMLHRTCWSAAKAGMTHFLHDLKLKRDDRFEIQMEHRVPRVLRAVL